jgi:hypothetical protein
MSDPLSRFDPPANWDDFSKLDSNREAFRDHWNRKVHDWTEAHRAGAPNYYNPRMTRIGNAQPARVEWSAFPKGIEDSSGSLAEADERVEQFEYCEWHVQRDARGKITRVTFTTELPEYWEALWEISPERVLALYRELVSPRVPIDDLRMWDGTKFVYVPRNRWNMGGAQEDGVGAVHMVVSINTLDAAIGVVVGATNAGDDNPRGHQTFHADALIILSVKRLVVRLNQQVSFSNPIGLYLQEPEFNRFELPSSAPRNVHPQDFWTVVRGNRASGHALRAVYEVPGRLGFTVGDIKIDGRLVQWGSQIARTLKSGTYVTPIPRAT